MKADNILINLDTNTRNMANDETLAADALGLLVYLLKRPNDIPFTIDQVLQRFKKERTWWHRKFKQLQEAQYARYEKTSLANGHMLHIYIIADNAKALTEYHVANMQPYHVANMQHGEHQTDRHPQEVDSPFQHASEVANMQHKKKEEDTNIYIPDARPTQSAAKFYDRLTITREDLALAMHYDKLNFPMIRTPQQWETARHPAVHFWTNTTQQPITWATATALADHLEGDQYNRPALKQAFNQWVMCGYKPTNINGILDWYTTLTQDMTATPWKYKGDSKNGNRNNPRRKSKKEHGTTKLTTEEASAHYESTPQPEWWNESTHGVWANAA